MQRLRPLIFICLAAYVVLALLMPAESIAQGLPKISVEVSESEDPQDLSVTLQIILLLTVLTLAPSIVMMLTSFTRIVIVLSFVRQAIGTNQMPPAQLIVGLALILTIFVMAPVISQVHKEAIKPYLDGEITQEQTYEKSVKPIRDFMLKQTREKDIALFVKFAGIERPEKVEDLPIWVIIPGFIISELRIAFQIAFVVFIPFLVIDMVVASVLMSMGMMMLPPIMVALPFKILLFVLVDGWYLIVHSLISSFYQ
ncbi:MAG: flagellar type III secretion system pore protein FliP [candidate division Zixibacteria bacterium]|nr:flagellar type III secretion system pore protein FliP [candidate division Zixibacteria bacterium]